jgi:hypothetical protein
MTYTTTEKNLLNQGIKVIWKTHGIVREISKKSNILTFFWKITISILILKKCVAYPQEDFLFTILYWGLLKASNLQAESKILKKNIGTPNLSIKTKNFEKKTVFRTLKVERGQKYDRTEFAGLTQNPKKNYENIKSTNQNEIFPKKSMFST